MQTSFIVLTKRLINNESTFYIKPQEVIWFCVIYALTSEASPCNPPPPIGKGSIPCYSLLVAPSARFLPMSAS